MLVGNICSDRLERGSAMPTYGKVFISHTHEDNELCERLVAALRAWNVDYWIDLGKLEVGDRLPNEIDEAIRERPIFVRIDTRAAMKSTWMDRELSLCIDLLDKDANATGKPARKLVSLVFSEEYVVNLLETDRLRIHAYGKTQSEWLDELRKALQVTTEPHIPTPLPDSDQGEQAHQIQAGVDAPASPSAPRSPALQAMLQEMDSALAAELKKVSHERTGHVATNGRLIGQVGGQSLYAFTLAELWEPQDDTPIRVNGAGLRHCSASVVTAVGNNISIAVSQQLSDAACQRVTLQADPTILLEKLREMLDGIEEPASQLGSKLFKIMPFGTGVAPLPALPAAFSHPTNSQQHAIQQALGNEVSYIIGPPGTGKTATLAAIAYALIKADKTALIVSHTNIAVDNAILKLAEYADGTPELRAGRIVRFGPPQLAAVRNQPHGKYIYPPHIASRIGQELDVQKMRIRAVRTQLLAEWDATQGARRQAQTDWQTERKWLSDTSRSMQIELKPLQQQEQTRQSDLQVRLAQASRDQSAAVAKVRTVDDTLTQHVLLQSQCTNERTQLKVVEMKLSEILAQAQHMNAIARFLRGINVENTARELSNVKQRRWQVEKASSELNQQLETLHGERMQAEQQHELAARRLQALETERQQSSPSARRIKELQQAIEQAQRTLAIGDDAHRQREQAQRSHQRDHQRALDQLNGELAAVEAQLTNLERNIVTNAQVVATTLSKLYMNPTLRDRRFDMVIIDEVSIAPLPTVLVAATHAEQAIIAIGDPKQLAPIVQAKDDAGARKWLGRDLFGVAGVTLEGAAHEDTRSVLLDTQFRMQPAISRIARKHVYEGLLHNGIPDQTGVILPVPASPLVLCDTSDAHPVTTRPSSGRSRYNEYHILCTIALAKQVLASLPQINAADATTQYRVGIATPYRPQAQRLQTALKEDKLTATIRAGTVHSFQGLEFEAVIFDTVESPPIYVSDLMAGGIGSDAMRLVNVAVTRPKHKLIIVANHTYLREKLGQRDTLLLAVEEARKACVISALDVVPIPVKQVGK